MQRLTWRGGLSVAAGPHLLTSGLQLWWYVLRQLSSPDPHYPALFHGHLISTKLLSACNTCVVPGSCIEI